MTTYPDATVIEYAYTERNQIAAVTADGPPPLATFSYDAAGNRVSRALENATTTAYSYDNEGQLLSVGHANSGGTVASAAYSYDSVHRRTSETRPGGVVDTYGYDGADQVTGVTYGGVGSATFAYDPAGNRTSVVDASGSATYGVANALNQYNTFGSAGTVAYDSNGNVSGMNSNAAGGLPVFAFQYDSRNRLVTGGGGSPSFGFDFTYDSRNRVVKRTIAGTTTWNVYDGWDLIAEYDSSDNLIARYVHGPVVDEILVKSDTSGSVYYHANALGSTVALTDETGALVERISYDVWGAPKHSDASGAPIPDSAYGNRFLFTGREYFSKLALYDYRNRTYSPALGRFMQADPIRFAAGDANLYRYVSNNPVNWRDPNGLTPYGDYQKLNSEEKALARMFPALAQRANELRKEADKATRERFPHLDNAHNNAADAWRHCYWSARMAQEFQYDSDIAKSIGDAHEADPDNNPREKAMDLHNNEVGRNEARDPANAGKSATDIANDAMKNSKLQLWE